MNDTVVDVEFGKDTKLPITTYTEEDFDRDLAEICSNTDSVGEENQVVKVCSHRQNVSTEKENNR